MGASLQNFIRGGTCIMVPMLLLFAQCTKPTIHYLRPTILITPDSRELFGCRINGKPFEPLAKDSATMGNCNYTAEVYRGDSGAVFQIKGNRFEQTCGFYTVGITLDSVYLRRGETYILGSPGLKKHYGSYTINTDCSQTAEELFTSDDTPGIITITKFDQNKKVITGTFDFKVKDKNGYVYRMSDGVFDRYYK